jgi:hypothetical protein
LVLSSSIIWAASTAQNSFAVASAIHESAVGVLAPACTVLGALDAASALARLLASVTPEEGPLVAVALHRCAWLAGVRLASTVRVAVVAIVLVVLREDRKGLGTGDAGVVAALGGLDSL